MKRMAWPQRSADAHLDDLIATLAQALVRTREQCAKAHLQRLQARLYRGGVLHAQQWQDGAWHPLQVPLEQLVEPGRILATTLEVQIDCEVAEAAPGRAGLPAGLVLLPSDHGAAHRLTIILHGGNPVHGQLLLDGQLLRPLLIPPQPGPEA